MPWLTQLADVARKTGYPVTEVAGWKTRGHGGQPAVKGIVCHHTAGRNDMHVVRDGRPGLSGPLSHFWLRRDGRIFVVAAGHCNHNAPSTSPHHTNSASLGIEAENSGSEPWPAVQVAAFKALCAELCKAFGLPASRVRGHKEVNRSKIDPHSISMDAFRADVAALMRGEPAAPAASWTEKLVKDLPLVKLGDKNYDVKTVRSCLFARGRVPADTYAANGLEGWLESTTCDRTLVELVKAFQRAEKLDPDGIVGPKTWTALLRVK